MGRIVKLLISLCFCPFLLFWRGGLSLFGLRARPARVVLMYHQVHEGERKRFAEQMDTLLKMSVPVPLGDSNRSKTRNLLTSVTFDDGIRNILHVALPELVDRGIHATIFFPTAFFGRYPDWIAGQDPQDESRWVMTKKEAASLPVEFIGIGSHSVNHKKLNQLTSEEIQAELEVSKTDLETLFGRPIDFVAFPYGEYDDRVIQTSKTIGYRKAFAADPVFFDGYVIGRIDTNPGDWPLEFRLKVLGAYRWLPIAFFLKRFLLPRK